MGEKIENGTIHVGEIIGKTLDGKDIYKFTELGTAGNVEIREPQYNDGDFVVNKAGAILIFKKKVGAFIYDHAYLARDLMLFTDSITPSSHGIKRYATEAEKQELLDALAKKGKRWNEVKKCVEDIPTPKGGDFLVREHDNGSQYIFILDYIDDDGLIYFHCCHSCRHDATYVAGGYGIGRIGDADHKCIRYATDSEKELLIAELSKVGKRWDKERKRVEDWLEPYEELKKGDLAIFWDLDKSRAFIGEYNGGLVNEKHFPHQDNRGYVWANAVKFESKKQFKRFIKGEL